LLAALRSTLTVLAPRVEVFIGSRWRSVAGNNIRYLRVKHALIVTAKYCHCDGISRISKVAEGRRSRYYIGNYDKRPNDCGVCNQQVVDSNPTAGSAQYQGLTQFHHLSGNTALSHFLATFLHLAAIA
jgi:hypothetical protein